MAHTSQTAARTLPLSPVSDDGSPLDSVETTFALLTTEPDPLALDGAAVGHGLPARLIALGELRSVLLHPATSHAARDACWAELVTRARTAGPAWVVGAAGVALPGLRRIAARLARGYGGDTADLDAEVLLGFVNALSTVDLERSRIPLRLCRAARKAGLAARYAEAQPCPPHLGQVTSAPPPRPWGHPDMVLADAVAKGVVTRGEAELIGRTRLEDDPLTVLATEKGLDYWAAHKRRYRAEARLARAVRDGDVGAHVSNQAT